MLSGLERNTAARQNKIDAQCFQSVAVCCLSFSGLFTYAQVWCCFSRANWIKIRVANVAT